MKYAPQSVLNQVTTDLENAMEKTATRDPRVEANQKSGLSRQDMETLGDRPVVFINSFNQIQRIDIRLQTAVNRAIISLKNLDASGLQGDYNKQKLVQKCFRDGVSLPEVLKEIEDIYMDYALEKCATKERAAIRMGISKNSLNYKIEKRKQLETHPKTTKDE